MEVVITKENFEKEVLQSDKPVIVDFWATWCGPCRMIAPELEQIAAERSDIKVCKVNVDEQEELAVAFKIASIPTLMLFKEGQAVASILGYRKKNDVLSSFNL